MRNPCRRFAPKPKKILSKKEREHCKFLSVKCAAETFPQQKAQSYVQQSYVRIDIFLRKYYCGAIICRKKRNVL